jgi:hypothetical protein
MRLETAGEALKYGHFRQFLALCCRENRTGTSVQNLPKTEKTSLNFRYISRFWEDCRCISTQYERRTDAMQEEVIREDEYVDICPNCGGLFCKMPEAAGRSSARINAARHGITVTPTYPAGRIRPVHVFARSVGRHSLQRVNTVSCENIAVSPAPTGQGCGKEKRT